VTTLAVGRNLDDGWVAFRAADAADAADARQIDVGDLDAGRLL
jgi:hypothetical protein